MYLIVAIQLSTTTAWIGSEIGRRRRIMKIGGIQEIPSTLTSLADQSPKAGSFFNPIPEDSGDSKKEDNDEKIVNIDDQIQEILRLNQQLKITSNDRPSAGKRMEKSGAGFAPPSKQLHTPKNQKPFVGIGPPLNDVTKPEYDANGYTLYADERTGVKSRVFEALIDYPCLFTLKIVGSDTLIGKSGNEKVQLNKKESTSSGDSEIQNSSFVHDILAIVAESCEVEYIGPETFEHSLRNNGKWTSITVKAPVKSAEMLYQLYEQVDRDPRVKFKF